MIKKRGNKLLIIVTLMTLGFGAAFTYNAYNYGVWLRDGQKTQETNHIIRNIFETVLEENGLKASFLDEIRDLTNNMEIIAYIHIEGTSISNAVAQGNNNDFYLYHDMFKSRNVNGTIFMDFRNSPDFSDMNTVIYGHNMRNGTMFNNLRYFMDSDFLEGHPYVTIITDNHIKKYEIFSTFSTDVDFYYIQVHFDSEGDFAQLLNEIIQSRSFETGIFADQNDKILILSTCTNADIDTRFVVAAKLIETTVIE